MGTAYTFFCPLSVSGWPNLAIQSRQICGLRLVTTVQYCCSPTSLTCTSHLLPVQYLLLSRSSADSGLDERQGLHTSRLCQHHQLYRLWMLKQRSGVEITVCRNTFVSTRRIKISVPGQA